MEGDDIGCFYCWVLELMYVGIEWSIAYGIKYCPLGYLILSYLILSYLYTIEKCVGCGWESET